MPVHRVSVLKLRRATHRRAEEEVLAQVLAQLLAEVPEHCNYAHDAVRVSEGFLGYYNCGTALTIQGHLQLAGQTEEGCLQLTAAQATALARVLPLDDLTPVPPPVRPFSSSEKS